jgi:tRNA (guanine-N(7)-)-methyltransferase
MRMRKKKHGTERLEACGDIIIQSGEDIKSTPVILEIGCGKGKFISELACRNKDKCFIGLEKVSDVLLIAAEKVKSAEITNVNFIVDDVKNLNNYLGEKSVSCIYLNFSDPWSKKGYHKRRLTYKTFLDIYKTVLADNGVIFMKTDNRGLFEFSIEQLSENGFDVRNVTYDLHNSPYAEDNIMTEYESNFVSQGLPIHRLEAYLL